LRKFLLISLGFVVVLLLLLLRVGPRI
jgi:hypothetical protein